MDQNRQLNDSSRAVYARLNRRKYAIIIALCLFCFFACIGDVLTAAASPAYRLSTRDVLNCLLHPTQATPGTYVIVIKMRLPIALMALVVGFSLGTAGATMQTILHNPLASP
jgi:iron complex transport system permease protein